MDSFVLQDILCENIALRLYTLRLQNYLCQNDLPMMFLAHYDRLSDDLKTQKPLRDYLVHTNTKMHASDACQLLGLPTNAIEPATHIKISGQCVIVWDEFPLALRLHFTNTAKDTQTLYGTNPMTMIANEAARFVFAGNVHILHKTPSKILKSMDLNGDEWVIAPKDTYTHLPNSHALTTTSLLNRQKDIHPAKLTFLQNAIVDKVMECFDVQK